MNLENDVSAYLKTFTAEMYSGISLFPEHQWSG